MITPKNMYKYVKHNEVTEEKYSKKYNVKFR